MSWREFERLVGEAFRQRGYTVTGFGGSGPDGGVDLGLMKNGERFLVQCKHWRKEQVGVTVVRELNGVIAAASAQGSFVVTGGQFTREAREFARGTPDRAHGWRSIGTVDRLRPFVCSEHGTWRHPRIVQKENRHSSGCDPMVVAEHSAEALSALNRVMG
jgi:hypothetical protein